MFAYADGVTDRPARARGAGRVRTRIAHAGHALNRWTREAFNPRYPRYPHLTRR